MGDWDERARFEAEEIRGLARMHGATREVSPDGIGFWRFPPWICQHCGLDADVQPGCPQPLARHGKISDG